MKPSKTDKEYNHVVDNLNRCRKLHLKDNKFHMIALNLSGNREKLEQQAMELIDKHGSIKALKKTAHRVRRM